MMNTRLDALLKTLESEQKRLQCQGRADEAALMRIRMNIVNIGKTVWQAVRRTEAAEKCAQVYLSKMESMRSAWQDSRGRAEKYGDKDKAMIEDIKLDTLEKVLAIFRECAE